MKKKYASLPFFLTLVSDKIQEVDRLIDQLKETDKEYISWNDAAISTLKNNLYWLKDKIDSRRDSVLAKNNKSGEYKF